ncbi:MAG: hypothetical protein ACKVVP_10640 [Chloroflexota bacterium]
MEENRQFRYRPAAAGRFARWRLRSLFLARLARLVRMRRRAPKADIRRRKFLDQAICSTIGDLNRLGSSSRALSILAIDPAKPSRKSQDQDAA